MNIIAITLKGSWIRFQKSSPIQNTWLSAGQMEWLVNNNSIVIAVLIFRRNLLLVRTQAGHLIHTLFYKCRQENIFPHMRHFQKEPECS